MDPKPAKMSMSIWLDDNDEWQWSIHRELEVIEHGHSSNVLIASSHATLALRRLHRDT